MRYALGLVTGLAMFGVVALADARLTLAQTTGRAALEKPGTIQIPKSVQAEHEEIHSTLLDATKAPGRVGTAARELAKVLHPHFVREEQIALPPLGLLAPLADRGQLPETVSSKALSMTDSLRSELPQMLKEHKAIRAAVEKLRLAAQAESAAKYERLAQQLAVHAQTEEEVLYPAAVLVGDILRSRMQRK